MAFDKVTYWAQKGQPRAKGRKCVILQCGTCKGSDGTLYKGQFVCNKPACQAKLQRRLAEYMVDLEAQKQRLVLAQAEKVLEAP